MRENSIISTIWKSFYSQSLYQDVKQNWRFAVAGYVFLLAVLYTLIATALEAGSISKFIQSCAQNTIQQIPTGTIVNGKMSIREASPYMVYYQEKNKPKHVFAIFDMTNKTAPAQNGAFAVFHSDGYFYDNSTQPGADVQGIQHVASNYTFHAYPAKGSFTFSAQQAQTVLTKVQHIMIPALFIGVGVLMFIFKLCQPIIYALIGLIFGGIYKLHLTYGEAYRLAVISSTPAFLIINLGEFFLHFPHPWLTAFIVEMIYLYFAVYSNRQGISA